MPQSARTLALTGALSDPESALRLRQAERIRCMLDLPDRPYRKRDADASLFAMEVSVRRRLFAPTIISLDQCAWSIWKLPIECLPIFDAASQELRPGRDGNVLWNRFREQAPELWMEPTQIVAAAVTVGSNAVPQPHDFGNQFLSTPAQDVRVHGTTTPMRFLGSPSFRRGPPKRK